MFKKTNKIISLLLVISMILLINVNNTYADNTESIENHWARITVERWIEKGFLKGYKDGTYRLDNNITRAEFIKLINNVMKFNEKCDIDYKDVKTSDWFYDDIRIAKNIGYLKGYPNNKIYPNKNIKREEAMIMLARVYKLQECTNNLTKFDDANKVDNWAVGLVSAAYEVEFFKGYDNNTIKPLDKIERAEALVLLDNAVFGGNVIINKDNQIVSDKEINGDVIITQSLAEGDATIKNCQVEGKVIVNGGGTNSIHINNTQINELVSNKQKTVRIELKNSSKIKGIELKGSCKLESLEKSNVDKIIVNSDNEVTLTGNIDVVTIKENKVLNLVGAKIKNLIIDEKTEINVDKNSTIDVATANAEVSLLGKGKISTLNVNCDNVSYEVKVSKVDTKEGVSKPEKIGSGSSGNSGGSISIPQEPEEKKIQFVFVNNGLERIVNVEYKEDTMIDEIKFLANECINDERIERLNNKFKNVKIKDKLALSESMYDRVAEILNIEKTSELYKKFKPQDFSNITLAEVKNAIDNVEDLVNHISANLSDIKDNVDNIDLDKISIVYNGTTKKLSELTFKIIVGDKEYTYDNLSELINYVLDENNFNMLTGKIKDIEFDKLIVELGNPVKYTFKIIK